MYKYYHDYKVIDDLSVRILSNEVHSICIGDLNWEEIKPLGRPWVLWLPYLLHKLQH